MATVYSLICWGGRTGKTVTVNASTDLVTLTNHGLRNRKGVAFVSGTLPTVTGAALTLNTTYYAKWISTSTFELYYDQSLTSKIDFTSTGASLVMKSAYLLGLSDLSRWGNSGSERIYDGLRSWFIARSAAADPYDTEFCEIGEAFDDIGSSTQIVLNMPSARTVIEPTVDGVKTAAAHNGVYGAGYAHLGNDDYAVGISITGSRVKISGISLKAASGGNRGAVSLAGSFNEVSACFIEASGASATGYTAVGLGGNANRLLNNVITAANAGIGIAEYIGNGNLCAYNTVTNCVTGLACGGGASVGGWYYCNISVGNATNWGANMPKSATGMGFNAGATGDPVWYKTTDTSIYGITTAGFVNAANNDFRLAAGSPLIDAGFFVFDSVFSDIAGDERPNYNNGGAEEYDIGAFEYDHGYGPHPASATISLTSIVSGSRVLITKASDGTVLYNDVPGASLSFSTTHIGDFNVVVRKASASPFYREFNASGTTVADQTTAIKCLQQLDE